MLSEIQLSHHIQCLLFLAEFNQKFHALRILIELSSTKVHANPFCDSPVATTADDGEDMAKMVETFLAFSCESASTL
jgi:hypothetical protein